MIGLIASSAVNLLPDETLVYQLVIFFFVVAILDRFLLRPAMAIVRRRDEMTKGTIHDIENLEMESEQFHQKAEERITREKQRILIEEEKKWRAMDDEVKQLILKARETAHHKIEEERKKIHGNIKQTEQALAAEVSIFEKMLLERLTGKMDESA